jgi:hypothetical protein
VRSIERNIEEEGSVSVFLDELQGPAHHHFGEILAGRVNLFGAFVKVVKAVVVQEVVVIVVDEPVADAEELIKALFLRAEISMRSQVPFAEERGTVIPSCSHDASSVLPLRSLTRMA